MAGQVSCESDSVLICDWRNFSKSLLAENGTPLLPDMQISCDGQTFDVQQILLAGFSPVLKLLITKNQENSSDRPLELPKEFVTKESFALILDLIYKGQITIDMDTVLPLHSAGNYLEIDQVTSKCADFVVKGISVDTVLPVFQYACSLIAGATRIQKEAVRLVDENFPKLFKHESLLALKKGELCLLLSQLWSVDDENLVLESALDWLAHDWKARFKDCEEVLSHVLWQSGDSARCEGLESLAMIKASVDGNSIDQMHAVNTIMWRIFKIPMKTLSHADVHYLIFEEEEDRLVIRKLFVSAQEPDNSPTVSMDKPQEIKPIKEYFFEDFFTFNGRILAVLSHEGDEKCSQGLMLAGVSENGDSKMLAQLEIFQVEDMFDAWVMITPLHGGIISILLPSFDGTSYTLATYDLRKFGRRLAFDGGEIFIIPLCAETKLLTETSHSSTPLPFSNDIYFFGGSIDDYNKGIYSNVFHMPDQKWSKLPCLQNYRDDPSVALVNGSFAVVGGRNRKWSVSAAVEMMSMDDPTGWTQLPGLKYGREDCHLIICGRFLIAFAGIDGDKEDVETAEILDMKNLAKGWEEYPPLHGACPTYCMKLH